MTPKIRRAIVVLCVLAGIGLCVAGIWVPPLMIPGGALIGGGLGMVRGSVKCPSRNSSNAPNAPETLPSEVGATLESARESSVVSELELVVGAYKEVTWQYRTSVDTGVQEDGKQESRLTIR